MTDEKRGRAHRVPREENSVGVAPRIEARSTRDLRASTVAIDSTSTSVAERHRLSAGVCLQLSCRFLLNAAQSPLAAGLLFLSDGRAPHLRPSSRVTKRVTKPERREHDRARNHAQGKEQHQI